MNETKYSIQLNTVYTLRSNTGNTKLHILDSLVPSSHYNDEMHGTTTKKLTFRIRMVSERTTFCVIILRNKIIRYFSFFINIRVRSYIYYHDNLGRLQI